MPQERERHKAELAEATAVHAREAASARTDIATLQQVTAPRIPTGLDPS